MRQQRSRLSEGSDKIHTVRLGDTVNANYRIEKIAPEAITLIICSGCSKPTDGARYAMTRRAASVSNMLTCSCSAARGVIPYARRSRSCSGRYERVAQLERRRAAANRPRSASACCAIAPLPPKGSSAMRHSALEAGRPTREQLYGRLLVVDPIANGKGGLKRLQSCASAPIGWPKLKS